MITVRTGIQEGHLKNNMENPWEKLTNKPPYILLKDQKVLEHIRQDNNFVYDVLPEPFLGSVKKAKAILLNLNPGFDVNDLVSHNRDDFIKALRNNLQHKPLDYPFYLLNPKFSDTPGYMWWNRKLRELIESCGRLLVAKQVACIEFFPYHSRRWLGLRKLIPSQEYGIQLVKQAIKDKKIILIMRAKREWFDCVPELKTYSNLLRLNSAQNVSVSMKNVSDKKFDFLVKAIKKS